MKKYLWLLLALLWIDVNAAFAEIDAQARGLEIAQEFDRRDQGYQHYSATMEMILINQNGDSSRRKLHTKTLERPQSEDESERRILIFDEPRDVRGTVLLTASRKRSDDEQWLYFPAIKRVKRIAAKSRSGPFMGSEFAYEDFSAPEVEKYRYRYLRTEPCHADECYVMERYPTDTYSGYSKQVLWIDSREYRLFKVEFYDRKETLMKVLVIDDYQQFKDRYWRAGTMAMENRQTGKKTVLNWRDYDFTAELNLRDFQPSSMQNQF